ncbi:hypothetical protein Tco_0266476 [Tanacetum coccineum]
MTLVGLAVELSPISYLEHIVDKCNLLLGGCLDSGISSLRSTGGGMDRGGGSGGFNEGSADTQMMVVKVVKFAWSMHQQGSPAAGGDSKIGGDGDGAVMARSLSTSASGGRDMEVWAADGNPAPNGECQWRRGGINRLCFLRVGKRVISRYDVV